MKMSSVLFWLAWYLPAHNAAALPSVDTPCMPLEGENLLENPRFEADAKGYRSRWSSSQHAGARVYRVTVEDGVLSIEKTGKQSWFNFAQQVDIREHAGQRLRFSAEIKLDMTEDPSHGFTQGGGLNLLIWGDSGGSGNQLLSKSTLDHEPRLGRTGWTPVAVTLDVPEGAVKAKAGFLHQANGTLTTRNPELRVLRPDCDSESEGSSSR